ncbi:hypothetical protein [Paenibacillus herberti]|uniref:ABC transporter permease n=1 Tax=Paenibacillus herberti TaxID=1619309 RepID=A0A229NUX1_9BACL|nr:hypothetical protein [Paenibacillus herberti]OXM13535.1 hypothetical protein CGZ75_21085 [Paenibacillus herberti]
MSTWRGAKLLTRYEWAMAGYGVIFNLILILYFLLFMTPLFIELRDVKDSSHFNGWMPNFIMLALIPCFGFFMNRASFNSWRVDHMSHRLADLRRLPISYRQIAAGKLLTVVSLLIPSLVLILLLHYLLFLHQILTPLQMLNYSLFWLGYGVLGSCIYALFEIMMTGKQYTILCIIFVVVFLGTCFAMMQAQWSIVLWTLEFAESGNWLPSLLAIAAGIMTAAFIYKLMAKLLSRRSLMG